MAGSARNGRLLELAGPIRASLGGSQRADSGRICEPDDGLPSDELLQPGL